MKKQPKKTIFIIIGLLLFVGLACRSSAPADPTATPETVAEPEPVVEVIAPEPEPTITTEPILPPTEEEPAEDLEESDIEDGLDELPAFFVEDFEDFDESGWSIERIGDGWDKSSLYADRGYLVIDLQGRAQEASFLYTAYTYSNVRMDITIHNRGANTSWVNFICNFSDRFGWYDISLSTGGEYKIWAYSAIDNEWDNIAQGGSKNIRTGRNENTYAVICQGNKITLAVNGQVEREFEDRKYYLTEGMVGFSVYSENVVPVIVDVDYFSISVP